MFGRRWWCVIFALTVGHWVSAEAQDGQVANFSFEKVGPDTLPVGWLPEKYEGRSETWRVLGDRKVAHRGKASLRVEIRRARTVVEVEGAPVAVQAGAAYVLSGWVRGQAAGSLRNGRAFLRLKWFTEKMDPLSFEPGETPWVRKGEEWMEVAGTFAAPEGARYASVGCVAALFSDRSVEHTVWFDDIALRRLQGDPPDRISLAAAPEVLPAKGPYRSRIRAVVRDSLDRPVADGTVVVFETDRGEIGAWRPTRDGVATATLRLGKDEVGGGRVTAWAAGVEDRVGVGDARAARLRGRIYDAETGRPLAAVVRVVLGDSTVWNAKYRKDPGFFADGVFEVLVPPGRVEVSTHRGFEYTPPAPQVLELAAGEVGEVALPYRQWVDMAARGWYGGDPYIPLSRGDRVYRTDIADIALAARVQGLHYALVTYDGGADRRPDLASYLNARVARVTTGTFRMGWNMAWPDGVWGLQWFMNVQNTAGMEEEMPGFEAHARIHDRRGIVSYTQPFRPEGVSGGLLFDTVAGPTYDAIDLMSLEANEVETLRLWYMLLNRGYRIAGTASSGAVLDAPDTWMPGRFRVYTHVEGEATLDRLARSIAEGHNFVTSGPLLLFSVFAAGPGAVLSTGGRRRATIRAWASADPEEYLTRVELVRNGEVAQVWDVQDRERAYRAGAVLQDTTDCWYIARCYGSDSTQVALTNPIYFQAEDFTPPEPVLAVVRGTVRDREGEDGLDAKVEVLDPLGKVHYETVALGGAFQIWVPPTSRIRVSHAGYQPEVQSVFLDSEISDLVLSVCHGPPEALYTWDTYEEVIQKLKQVTLNFQLERKR